MVLTPLEILEIVATVVVGIVGFQLFLALWKVNRILTVFARSATYVDRVNDVLSIVDNSVVKGAADFVKKYV